MSITDKRLTEIQARVEAATEGPWDDQPNWTDTARVVLNGDGEALWDAVGLMADADADFIAHAREDIPALLAEIDRLRGQLADAWGEGAEYAWSKTGEGFNGEYTDEAGTHDGKASFKSQMPEASNPYLKDQS